MSAPIKTTDFWCKARGVNQQNWGFVETLEGGNCRILFIDDNSGVFDVLEFVSAGEAETALKRNGFGRYADDPQVRQFILPPEPPYHASDQPNGAIYSTGDFWV